MTAARAAAPPPAGSRFRRRRRRHLFEQAIGVALFLCAAATVATTVGIVAILLADGLAFFEEVSPWDFFTGTRWTPLFSSASFGVLPLVAGTMLVAVGASLVAIPIGTVSAIFLAEYASPGLRAVIKPVLEVLAGVPTVVYGYFALTFVTPALGEFLFRDIGVFNALSAMIVVGIMIVPMVSSLSDDAMRAVPQDLREAAHGVGANRFEVSTRVVFPAALSGVIASYVLAVSRAVGETMAVTIAAGATPRLTANPLESVQTMSSYIVNVSLGDTPQGTIEFRTIFAVALTLFFMTLALNLLSRWVVSRFREEYA
ncbi:MAG: phosphate ABC transporter permease subunit PstC [Chloroflexi bacterium]|nr:phosphate ABC transporter permease subunit PstC [Chloroflexota bacterium]